MSVGTPEDPAVIDPEKFDPSKYKDMFKVPANFDEAYNHPDPFQ